MQRGVFYTPRPIVSFIVRSVDRLLRTDFGLIDGLADITSWAEMARRRPGLIVPQGTPPEQPFVQILDPATGTGTFLVEAIGLIYETMVDKWMSAGKRETQIAALWNEYVPKHLLPRLHGYELLMAPYAIAHLKLGLKLHETGYQFQSDERARIYLTNALEPASLAQQRLEGILPALAHEANAVATIKQEQRFTVLVANPPYANYSANLSDQARSLVDKYRKFAGKFIRERNQLQFERNIQDDFVKFISIAETEIERAGVGIIGYITNATMLASNSLRGMREHILRQFDLVQELHLHGGVNEIGENATNDQNVFEIAQAVAIHSFARRPKPAGRSVQFAELWGSRADKYLALSQSTIQSIRGVPIEPDGENCSFSPSNHELDAQTARISDVFKKFGAGIKTNRDSIAIRFNASELRTSMGEFDPALATPAAIKKFSRPILYRPFDERVIFYHENVVASRSLPTMKHMMAGPNVGLIASSTWTSNDRFSVGISDKIVEMKTGTHDRGTTLFPLYRYEGILGGQTKKIHNLNPEFLSTWYKTTGIRISSADTRIPTGSISPDDLQNWIYAICYSPKYRHRYSSSLAKGFPLLLFPKDRRFLDAIVRLGNELACLHLMKSARLERLNTAYVGPPNPEVRRLGWSSDTVWLDAGIARRDQMTPTGSMGFKGVSRESMGLSPRWLPCL